MRESLVLLFVLLLLFIPSAVCRDHPMPWTGKRVWRRQGYVRAVPRCVHKSLEEAGQARGVPPLRDQLQEPMGSSTEDQLCSLF